MNDSTPHPTQMLYNPLMIAFQFFNREFWNGVLTDPVFIISRSRNTRGHYGEDFWCTEKGDRTYCEIAINIQNQMGRTVEEMLSTLVHEMCHQWQAECGTPPSKAYHDRQWADEMERVGLMPSHTGEPGGKRTGRGMTHYILEGGAFQQACRRLVETTKIIELFDGSSGILWTDVNEADPLKRVIVPPKTAVKGKHKAAKTKYTCGCGQNLWGKPGLQVQCSLCLTQFEEKE